MIETNPTILYIEDDPANRRLVERVLSHSGYTIYMAVNGLDGIDRARELLPDLVLTDINLPDLSGHEIATVLRGDSRFENIPIVAFTAMGYGDHQEMAMAAGINGFLLKPLDVEKFPAQIKFYLDGGKDKVDTAMLSTGQTKHTREVVGRLESRIRQLEEANAALQRLDNMKQTFIQITAHELRTPLTLVFGYIRLIEDYPSMKAVMRADPAIKQLVEGVVDSTARMHSIINEILIIGRIMTGTVKLTITQTNLGMILHKVIGDFKEATAERKLTIHLDESQFPRNMQADGELLRLAFKNLIGNAIKFTPDGGQIYITCETNPIQTRIIVQDTGIGIDKSEQKFIFEQFHMLGSVELHSSSKTAFGGGGLGLGLPISKGIIEAHEGKITVESEGRNEKANPGSTFTVILPIITKRPPKSKS